MLLPVPNMRVIGEPAPYFASGFAAIDSRSGAHQQISQDLNLQASGGQSNVIVETGCRQSNTSGGGRAKSQWAGEVCGGCDGAGHGLGKIAAQSDRLGKD